MENIISVKDMSLRIRKDNNLTQAGLAKQLYVTQGAIGTIETGRTQSGETAELIRELYYKHYGKPESVQTEVIEKIDEEKPIVIEEEKPSPCTNHSRIVEVAISRMIEELNEKSREIATEINVLTDARERILEDIAELRKEIGLEVGK